MSVSLRVGPIAYPVGRADFLGSFFEPSQLGSREVLAARGSRLSQGCIGMVSCLRMPRLARVELADVERELRQHRPADVVWDIDKPDVSPPWGSDIADTITSLGDYFVTADGRQLIAVMDTALDASVRTGKPVRIA